MLYINLGHYIVKGGGKIRTHKNTHRLLAKKKPKGKNKKEEHAQ
jgi:hypothetical protein